MARILTCRRCLYPDSHPLGLTIDEAGICSGCRIHEEKDRLDWNERWRRLEALVQPYRASARARYDCIVPVTGANDSYFTVHLVKERLGLNPLLVAYNKYFNTSLGIRNLANLRIKFDCDIVVQNVNPHAVKKITRTTLREFGSVYWPCLAGHTVFPVQTAVRYGVPLIVWGAHQGLEQVGMFSHEHEVEMTRRYRKDHDLLGREADDLLSDFDTLSEADIWQFRYPDDVDLQRVGVRGIYLGNYVRWDPKAQHEQMVLQKGYLGAAFARTFDTYDHVDCYNFMDIHDYLKLMKHGFSKVTDHACREIRHGRLSREQGLALVDRHSSADLAHVEKFCAWLGVERRSLEFMLNQHRSQKHWHKMSPNEWRRIEHEQRSGDSASVGDCGFAAGSTLDMGEARGYITVGKGWP